MVVAVPTEPPQLEGFLGGSGVGGGGVVRNIVHALLSVPIENGTYQPQLSPELPSPDRGTWRVNADGSMDTTWKLRPGIKWHDGTPFTAEDMVFAYRLRKDPALPPPGSANVIALWESARVIDPLTFEIHWSASYWAADRAEALGPLPKHILEEPYQRGDADAFVIHPYFRTDFVGLGPYRLSEWNQGAQMTFTRYDDFFMGRPPLDTVVLRFISDPNTMAATILAGAVDVIPGSVSGSVGLDAALEIQKQWEGTGNLVNMVPAAGFRVLEPQMRPELARPRAGLPDVRVRQALMFGTDRDSLNDVMRHGLAKIADSWIEPADPNRPQQEPFIPKYPYDLRRAQQLLTDAGWTAGPDGVLVHSGTVERFELVLRATQVAGGQTGKDVEAQLLANDWKKLGIQSNLDLAAIGTATSREYDAKSPGMLVSGAFGNPSQPFQGRYESRYIAGDANRWGGQNLEGYSDPEADVLLPLFNTTIEPRQRLELERQLLRKLIGEVAFLPTFWEVTPVLMVKGVSPFANARTTYKFYAWDKE
jgi:peptide/nickel transport system substrate-binding protein